MEGWGDGQEWWILHSWRIFSIFPSILLKLKGAEHGREQVGRIWVSMNENVKASLILSASIPFVVGVSSFSHDMKGFVFRKKASVYFHDG